MFLSHQVGSFSGAWLAGYAYDPTGNDDFAWTAPVTLGIAAAAATLGGGWLWREWGAAALLDGSRRSAAEAGRNNLANQR